MIYLIYGKLYVIALNSVNYTVFGFSEKNNDFSFFFLQAFEKFGILLFNKKVS